MTFAGAGRKFCGGAVYFCGGWLLRAAIYWSSRFSGLGAVVLGMCSCSAMTGPLCQAQDGQDKHDDDDKADRRERAEILHGPPDVPRFPVEIDRRKKSGDLKSVRPAAPATTNPTVAAFATRHRVLLYRF